MSINYGLLRLALAAAVSFFIQLLVFVFYLICFVQELEYDLEYWEAIFLALVLL